MVGTQKKKTKKEEVKMEGAQKEKTKEEAIRFDPASITSTEQPLVSRLQSSFSSYGKAGAGFGEAMYQLHQAVRTDKEKYLIEVNGRQQETGRLNAILNHLQIPRSTAYFWLRRHKDSLAAQCPQDVIAAVIQDSPGTLNINNDEHVALVRRAWLEAKSPEQPNREQIRMLSTAACRVTSSPKKLADGVVVKRLFLSFCQLVLKKFNGDVARANTAITPYFLRTFKLAEGEAVLIVDKQGKVTGCGWMAEL